MAYLTLVSIAAVVSGLVVNVDGQLQPIDVFSMKNYLQQFRTAILDEIAQQWNVTISQAEVLRKMMTSCDAKMLSRVNMCKNCTSKLCQTQPAFSDYMNQVDPMDSLKQPLEQMGSGLSDVVKLLGTSSFGFLDAVKGITIEGGIQFGNGFESVVKEISQDFNKLPDLLSDGGQRVLDGLGDLGNGLSSGLNNFANSIGDGMTDAGLGIYHGLAGLFGRRRRDYNAAASECMKRCDDVCWQLMSEDNNVVLTNVCGAYVVTLNKTIHHSIDKVTALYNATLDTAHPIITEVEIDRSKIDPATLSTDIVYITAYIKGQRTRYQSSVPYRLMDMPSTIRDVTREFWRMWG